MQSNKAKYNPQIHHRHSIRLKGYDYSQEGLYFVTICIQDRVCLLGEVKNGEMILNEYGKMVEYTWNDLPNHNKNIQLGAFCIMPNHIHGIIEIIEMKRANLESAQMDSKSESDSIIVRAGSQPALGSKPALDHDQINRAGLEPAPKDSDSANINRAGLEPAPTNLSEIIRQFKTFSARRINEKRQSPGTPVWQRNYYEHIIRHQQAFDNITNYIETNPTRWDNDKFFKS